MKVFKGISERQLKFIKDHARSLDASKVNLLKRFEDGSLKVLFITNNFNVCYKIKGSLFDQLYIDYGNN